ncbi:hypothetical protein [Paraburkholderia sp.]|uniref:hypothetical protein n=1 Tax=Paraburkholderia sp. TaxID=1926495 RepID=UPI0025DCBE93|nr:hypothetical protein [Paraburkholderia sp.]
MRAIENARKIVASGVEIETPGSRRPAGAALQGGDRKTQAAGHRAAIEKEQSRLSGRFIFLLADHFGQSEISALRNELALWKTLNKIHAHR